MKIKALMLSIIFLGIFNPVFAQEEDVKKSFVQSISFEEGTFLSGVNKTVIKWVTSLESWRKERAVKFEQSLDSVDEERKETKDDDKTIKKSFIAIKILIMAIILFIFSLQAIFYIIATIIAYLLLRRVFRAIKRVFRRDGE